MSTNISTAFDAIKAKMIALFPEASGYIQLSNPYDIEENTVASCEQGWGVAFGSGQNLNLEVGCRLSMQRTITITLTRRRYANELDTANKEDAEKLLFEDQYKLIQALELEPALDSSTSGIAGIGFSSDDGVEVIFEESDAYIKLSSEFELKYFEHLES